MVVGGKQLVLVTFVAVAVLAALAAFATTPRGKLTICKYWCCEDSDEDRVAIRSGIPPEADTLLCSRENTGGSAFWIGGDGWASDDFESCFAITGASGAGFASEAFAAAESGPHRCSQREIMCATTSDVGALPSGNGRS